MCIRDRLNTDGLDLVWQEFYDQQFQKDLKYYCDTIIDQVIALENKPIPKLSMLQESYINGILEKKFSIEMIARSEAILHILFPFSIIESITCGKRPILIGLSSIRNNSMLSERIAS